jgi:hypothetical protein
MPAQGGGLLLWHHRAHKRLRAFKVVALLCACGLRLYSAVSGNAGGSQPPYGYKGAQRGAGPHVGFLCTLSKA